MGLQAREVRDDWHREFGVQTDTKSTNVPRAASNQHDKCGHIPLLPDPEQRQSCGLQSSQQCQWALYVPQTGQLRELQPPCAQGTSCSRENLRWYPTGKSSKRWSLPCPSDYLSGSGSFSHTWHKIKEKSTTISLANIVSWMGWDFEGRGNDRLGLCVWGKPVSSSLLDSGFGIPSATIRSTTHQTAQHTAAHVGMALACNQV